MDTFHARTIRGRGEHGFLLGPHAEENALIRIARVEMDLDASNTAGANTYAARVLGAILRLNKTEF